MSNVKVQYLNITSFLKKKKKYTHYKGVTIQIHGFGDLNLLLRSSFVLK